MYKYVSVAEMIAIEREADASGHSYTTMMQHAGNGLAKQVAEHYAPLQEGGILGLIGSGNNGGDTLVALTWLAENGWRVSAYFVKPKPADDPLVRQFQDVGGSIQRLEEDKGYKKLSKLLQTNAVLLDGVLGTGIRLPLRGEVAKVLNFVRQLIAEIESIHVVAVDCPSGVDCDSGQVADECIPAERTISMAAYKRGLLMFPAYNLVGDLVLVGIGLDDLRRYPPSLTNIRRFVPDRMWVQETLPVRPLDAHKGTFGTALIAAGSINYTGAVYLSGKSAYRVGTGLVTLAVPEPIYVPLAGRLPECTWLLLAHKMGVIAEDAWRIVRDNCDRATALLLGPGFGIEDTTRRFIENLLSGAVSVRKARMGLVRETELGEADQPAGLPPLVVDADGLKLLAQIPNWSTRLPVNTILTPHPGEMAIMSGETIETIQHMRVEIAEKYAKKWGHILVLKGAFTVVASPDGDTAVIPVANPALARAGTGDVLAGVIVGLRAQGVDALKAAVAGAWIHAQAGLSAAGHLGSTTSVLAGDVLVGVEQVMADINPNP